MTSISSTPLGKSFSSPTKGRKALNNPNFDSELYQLLSYHDFMFLVSLGYSRIGEVMRGEFARELDIDVESLDDLVLDKVNDGETREED